MSIMKEHCFLLYVQYSNDSYVYVITAQYKINCWLCYRVISVSVPQSIDLDLEKQDFPDPADLPCMSG